MIPAIYWFPLALMTGNIGAAVMYGLAQDWWKVGYWVSACVLTGCVTFGSGTS